MSDKKDKAKYRANSNLSFACYYHVVWTPKYRRKLLAGPVAARLETIIGEVCGEYRAEVVELAIQPDHVHLLLKCDPQFGITRLMKLVRGRSSRLLRQEFLQLGRLPSLWTNSYSLTTTGGAAVETVRRYIQKQQTEHES